MRAQALLDVCRFQIIGEADRQGDGGEGRIGATSGREQRGPRNIEIAHAVNPALPVNDPLPGVAMHSRCAHVMPSAMRVGWRVFVRKIDLDAAKICLPDFFVEDALRVQDASDVLLFDSPVEPQTALTEAVQFRAQRYSAIGIWDLLGHVIQKEDGFVSGFEQSMGELHEFAIGLDGQFIGHGHQRAQVAIELIQVTSGQCTSGVA